MLTLYYNYIFLSILHMYHMDCIYNCMYSLHIYIYIYIYMYIYIYVFIYIYICIYTYVYIYIYIYMCVFIIYIYICVYLLYMHILYTYVFFIYPHSSTIGQRWARCPPHFLSAQPTTKAQRSRRAKPCGSSSDATARPKTTQAICYCGPPPVVFLGL